MCMYINTSYAYTYGGSAAMGRKDKRLLGGYDLSDEAKKIKKKRVWSMQRRSSYSNSPDMNQI